MLKPVACYLDVPGEEVLLLELPVSLPPVLPLVPPVLPLAPPVMLPAPPVLPLVPAGPPVVLSEEPVPGVPVALPAVPLGVVPGAVAELLAELPAPLSVPEVAAPVLPAAPLEGSLLDGALLLDGAVLEGALLDGLVVLLLVEPASLSFLPHALNATAATNVASNTGYFMLCPLK